MYKEKRIICLIPARGGSKRLPGKNIKSMLGKPLISYAITAAKQSKYVDRVIVTTDDEAIAAVAREYGAEVPFMRPVEIAGDNSSVLLAMQHAVTFLENSGEHIDWVMLIQPTVPGVLVEDVDKTVEQMGNAGTKSCVSVCDIIDPPDWMYRLEPTGKMTSYLKNPDLTSRSQDLEKLYRVNGAVYITLHDTLMVDGKIVDNDSCAGAVMPRERSTDIDTAFDFKMAETLLAQQQDSLT